MNFLKAVIAIARQRLAFFFAGSAGAAVGTQVTNAGAIIETATTILSFGLCVWWAWDLWQNRKIRKLHKRMIQESRPSKWGNPAAGNTPPTQIIIDDPQENERPD